MFDAINIIIHAQAKSVVCNDVDQQGCKHIKNIYNATIH